MRSVYEKGSAWYFSNANTRQYSNGFFGALDWMGRKLSFLSTLDFEIISHQTHQKPSVWNKLKLFIWDIGLGRVLGAPGAFFRWISSVSSNDIDTRHYQKDGFTLSDVSHTDSSIASHKQAGNEIKLLTLNVACLPYKPWIRNHHVNEEFLRKNSVRVKEIADKILTIQPDIISFQEAFDDASQKRFIKRLSATYPYILHHVGDKFLNAGSGLMLFSKFPILDAEFHRYTNTMIGEETIANKGFLACKVQISKDNFISVYNTHTQSGGGILKKLQSWWSGTTSARRGVEFGEISNHMDVWEQIPPPRHKHLTHLSTHLTGDLNTGLNNERSMLSISTGMSKNRYKEKEVKYPGQFSLFSRLQKITPINFLDIRAEKSLVKGERKPNDPEKVKLAEADDSIFTGTAPTKEVLSANLKQRAEIEKRSNRKIIDGMFMANTKNSFLHFKSEIVSFQNSTDHFGVQGTLTRTNR